VEPEAGSTALGPPLCLRHIDQGSRLTARDACADVYQIAPEHLRILSHSGIRVVHDCVMNAPVSLHAVEADSYRGASSRFGQAEHQAPRTGT
jgi:hypothetical protein